MARNWDYFEYRISGHYLPALINADESGLEDSEQLEFHAWEREARQNATASGFMVGHWDCDSEESDDWGMCAVCGLHAMRQTVRLMVYKN
jgi:hypothetical protein